jgi:predicted O-methyltransferase YrrM
VSDELSNALEGVEGWLHLDEAEALQQMVRESGVPKDQPITVLEIGSFKGRSAIAFALAIRARGEGRLYAVDPHWGGSREDFFKNIEKAGMTDLIIPIELSSHDARAEVADASLDVVFIDGGHEYEEVCLDISDWTSAFADVALVAFNDTHFPGVYKALKEKVLRDPAHWSKPHLVRSTLFLQYNRAGLGATANQTEMRRMNSVLAVRRQIGVIKGIMPEPVRRAGNWVSRRIVG